MIISDGPWLLCIDRFSSPTIRADRTGRYAPCILHDPRESLPYLV